MAAARHQYRIYIKASIDQVWAGIVDPEFMRRYFYGAGFDSAPQPGQGFRTTTKDGLAAVDGTIEILEPPHRLVMTWHVLYDAAMETEPPSRVEWTLTEAGEGLTQVDLVHGDLARSPLTWAYVKDRWVWILDGLKTLLETGETLPEATIDQSPAADDPVGDWHRAQAIESNSSTWELIEKADRTADDDEEMLCRAYASAYHWRRAARRGPENHARAWWMLSKVQLLIGNAHEAKRYADLCMAQCHEHDLVDFDLAYAFEVQARALHALGNTDHAASAWAAALAVPIADPEDKAIVEADLAIGP